MAGGWCSSSTAANGQEGAAGSCPGHVAGDGPDGAGPGGDGGVAGAGLVQLLDDGVHSGEDILHFADPFFTV